MKSPSTARTAGRSDWAERRFRRQPFILLSFSSSKKLRKRRKCSHTNVSNTLVARPSTPPAQTPQRSFQRAAAGTHSPSPTGSHTAAYTAKHGAFCAVRKPCARSGQKSILCHLCMDRGNVGEKQRAFGTAMRSCASLFRGVAAPLGCVISWLFLSPHRRASRFWSAASLARRKLSGCSLVTAVRFLNRCSRRSMRETYPLGQRSGCQF